MWNLLEVSMRLGRKTKKNLTSSWQQHAYSSVSPPQKSTALTNFPLGGKNGSTTSCPEIALRSIPRHYTKYHPWTPASREPREDTSNTPPQPGPRTRPNTVVAHAFVPYSSSRLKPAPGGRDRASIVCTLHLLQPGGYMTQASLGYQHGVRTWHLPLAPPGARSIWREGKAASREPAITEVIKHSTAEVTQKQTLNISA
jgi:hypothetical protein